MANLNVNPQARAQLGYNGFDLSKMHKFSSSVGHIIPVFYDLANPGDKYDISTQLKTRTMNLDSAAMMSITENVDWFFVPLTQLYQWFDSFFYGIQDFKSDFYPSSDPNNTKDYTELPYVKYFSLVELLNDFSRTQSYIFHNVDVNADSIRLLDSLGVPIKDFSQFEQGDDTANFSFNLLLFQAYQKIYMDYYRLSDRELNDPSCYNLDSAVRTNYKELTASFISKYFTLRYVPWKKDFFTNVFVSPVFGPDDVSSINTYDYGAVNQWLTSQYSFGIVDSHGDIGSYPPVSGSSPMSSVGIPNASFDQSSPNSAPFNVANIRTMFSIDKLLEVTRRAGKHYDKQTLAHFGVEVPQGISGEVFFVNHSESKIEIGDVISTSTGSATIDGRTATSALGQVGGKGFGFGENRTSYTAPCHGILMAVYYARPDVDYITNGFDRINTYLKPEDFYHPEYDDLGMQPLFKYQTLFSGDSTDDNENSTIIGWQYRYSEIKQKYNSVNSGLAFGNLDSWTPKRLGVSDSRLINFLVNPTYLNSVMSVDYESHFNATKHSIADVFQTDPLIHQMYFDVRKASKMSTYGLPNL